MHELIRYVKELQDEIELTLKMKYEKYTGWTIEISEKGYSNPLVYVNDKNEHVAFCNARKELIEKLGRGELR